MQVSVAEASNKLPELIQTVEQGERVTICRDGSPVVDLVPAEGREKRVPKLGTLKGKVWVDPKFFEPMTDEEVDAFIDGRY